MKTNVPTKIFFCPLNSIKQFKKLLGKWTSSHVEPTIQSKRDGRGSSYFQIYDPTSRKSFNFSSEQEVRIWLEQRYYQDH